MTAPLDLAAVKARSAACKVSHECAHQGYGCERCEAEAVTSAADVPALVAEVERLAANLDTFREAIRLLHAHCDDDPDEAAHTPPHIRQAIMDYDQRAALRAAGGG